MSLRLTRPQFRNFSTKFDKFELYGGRPIPANKQRLIPTSGSYPKGFNVGSTRAGIKPAGNVQPDLLIVASDTPASGAAVLTKNEFCAASVTVTRELMRRTNGARLRGVIANSGCANTLTGQAGLDDAIAMGRVAAKCISTGTADKGSSLMVMHTGAGAQRLPIDNVLHHIPKLAQSMGNTHDHWLEAAVALSTTDTYPKLISRTFSLPSAPQINFSLAGLTKGAGMVHPNMATTLGIICTDAPITPTALQILLRGAASKSYNCISIDGDTSTNDMVTMFANGAAASSSQPAVDVSPEPSADFVALQHVLSGFMSDMAKLVVRDAEGASKFITIRVRGSPSYDAAHHIASVIARSVLWKTGIYGLDPNWHGILAALGYSLLDTSFAGQGIIIPEQTSVSFMDGREAVKFLDRGVPVPVDEARIKQMMEKEDLETIVDLRYGTSQDITREEAVYWTCDMTHDFISMNSGVDFS
ncbi:Peptidase S58 DmpA/arginine biosynthesis protein ArgJ [Penicillium fimorum]|uniref:Arginine biosynthesis bifunctional protein ArgJ, mitochondrial n=1 Tax=Penicillium fimorum TaxID=1882269 RepID=A0A9W9XP15_9EURO|nr:Peptidase S58 DmpA/arginine biosynthesis protein ArgJ [Penicillium fimorum]